MGKWKYHTSHAYKTGEGKEISFMSQLYKIGVYGIVNNDPDMQISTTPGKMAILEKKLKKEQKEGKITDLVFGREITVSDETGFFEEVK